MGKRDNKYQLDQIIELDEGFFKAPLTDTPKDNNEDETPKRGRGSQSQAKVLVMVSFRVSMDKNKNLDKYQKPTQLKYIKMLVIDDLRANTIMEQVEANIRGDSVVKQMTLEVIPS